MIRHKTILILLVFWLIFFLKGVVFLDPDFGWRVAAGNYYRQHGVMQKDIFSYTMEGFGWVDHAWVATYLMSWGEERWGRWFLSGVFSTICVASMYITFKISRRNNWESLWDGSDASVFVWGLFSILFLFFGIRAQVFSWFFLAILLLLLERSRKDTTYLLSLPLLFLLWANTHGSFAMGVVILSVFVIFSLIRQDRSSARFLVLLSLSFLVTFINPYGVGVWKEVLSSVLDGSLRSRIIEWMPSYFMPNIVMVFYLSLISTFVFIQRRSVPAEWLVLYLFFLIQALLSRRHLPLWMIVSYYPFFSAWEGFIKRLASIKYAKERFAFLYKRGLMVILFITGVQFVLDVRGALSLTEDKFYPKNAIEYLKGRGDNPSIFTEYTWGGYLLWKMPGEKVFIDGRMPSWKDADGYKAMDDYISIISGEKSFSDVANQRDIDYVLWPKREYKNIRLGKIYPVDRILRLLGAKDNNFVFDRDLLDKGWRILYEDSVAVVYTRV